MKSFAALICFAFFVHALMALVVPVVNQHGQAVSGSTSVPLNCDYRCTPADLPVCTVNGQCMQKFKSKCAFSAYNCQNPQKPFLIVEDFKCEQTGDPLCQLKELGSH